MHFLSIITAISGVVAVAIPNTTATNGTIDSFSDSCETYGVWQVSHDIWLGGYCRNNANEHPYSSLNLNQYVHS